MTLTFSIEYHTRWGESLCLVTGDEKHPMKWGAGDIWSVTLTRCSKNDLENYGYVVMENGLIRRSEWKRHSLKLEKGLKSACIKDSWIDCPVGGCPFEREHQAAVFDRPGFRGAGTAIPVFSLRSENDFGIGEFRDLRPLVDWAAATGQCIIQLLPINDTTRKGSWDDSYPYSPVSSFALNPMYMHLQDIGVKETPSFLRRQKELNRLPEIDYPAVFKEKSTLMLKAFREFGARDLAGSAFKRFYKENADWLGEYAEFCSRRDGLETEYFAWVQFHLDRQLSEEVAYARSKGVSLKGDLPIGVSADSAEAYWHTELFNLDCCAGAPPDFFSADGQNWGFPTYNWDAMAADGYAWWKRRLRKMAQYFDAFRIDHILGFFRIWEIPAGASGLDGHFNPALPYSTEELEKQGLCRLGKINDGEAEMVPFETLFIEDMRRPGWWHPRITPDTSALQPWQKERFEELYIDFFYRRHNDFWRHEAERKLPELLGATGMLACGEDLGMVPDCVPVVMDHEKILSLEMQQMEKGRPWPYLSVCATSSHDLETLRMRCGDPEPWQVRNLLRDHLESASMLAIFPLQDWVALDGRLRRPDAAAERINEPADPHHHWRYRFHIPLEKLGDASELRMTIEGLLKDSGRFN